MTIRESRPEGAIVYWNGAPTDRQKLFEGLTATGMEDYVPCQRTEAASLKMALEEFIDDAISERRSARTHKTQQDGERVIRDKIVQPLRNQKENGFEVVDVTRKDDQNDYVVDFAAKVIDGQVQISRGYASQAKVQRAYEVYRATLGGSAIGGALIDIVKDLGGVTLRDSGGIYWLANDKLEQWEKVISAFEAAGDNQVYMVRTIMDAKTVRAVNDAIVDEVTKRSAELADEIMHGKLGEQAIDNRLQSAKALHARVREYESILGQTMQHLHQVIGIAEVAASSATAIKEDSSVFDEMFAEA